MDIEAIVKSIVEHQQQIVGPLAVEQANKVTGLKVLDGQNITVSVSGSDDKKILAQLVEKYEVLFGRASIEVCKDAIREIRPKISAEVLPDILH